MPFYLPGCVLANSQLSSSPGFSLLSVPLSLPSLCILWEAVVWSTFNGFVRDILDFSRRSDTLCVCVCVPTSVCAFLDCRVGSHIRRFSTCVTVCTHTPKPLDSIRNPEAENFEAESGAIDRLLSCRARLSALDLWYSTDLHCSYSCTFT